MRLLNWTAFALGAYLATIVIENSAEPFVSWGKADLNVTTVISHDAAKQAFVTVFKGTFQDANPYSEYLDEISGTNRAHENEVRFYYESFAPKIKKININGCPTKRVVVPTVYQNAEAEDRVFIVFDVENCKLK